MSGLNISCLMHWPQVGTYYSANIDLLVDVTRHEQHYFAIGELSDVHRCLLAIGGSTLTVAVKVLRGISLDGKDKVNFEKQFTSLVRQWKELNHPNIMPFYGLTTQFGPIPGIVLPYYQHGSILRYLKSHDVDPYALLLQVAEGVTYLHSISVVHGDIRASNVMVKSDGAPVLMDCGIQSVVSYASHLTTAGVCNPCRWMAPEVLDPPEDSGDDGSSSRSVYTPQSDVYSLGMTILEVLTKKVPFSNRRFDTVVLLEVIRGIKPTRPKSDAISDDIWNLMQACWEFYPEHRLSASAVQRWLKVIFYAEMSRRSVLN